MTHKEKINAAKAVIRHLQADILEKDEEMRQLLAIRATTNQAIRKLREMRKEMYQDLQEMKDKLKEVFGVDSEDMGGFSGN